MKPLRLFLSVFSLLPLLSGCFSVPCTLELEARLEPRAVTLEVGESVTPTVGLYTCGGREIVTDTFIWSSGNPRIASVERTSGTITAHAVGQVEVEVLAQAADFTQIVNVTVVAAK